MRRRVERDTGMRFSIDLGNPITYYRFVETLSNSPHLDLQLIAESLSSLTPPEHRARAIEAARKSRPKVD